MSLCQLVNQRYWHFGVVKEAINRGKLERVDVVSPEKI